MKRIIFLIAICLSFVGTASAQFNLSKLLNGLTTEAAKNTESDPYKRLAESAPASSTLNGKWSYESASFSYIGNNPLAGVVIAQLDPVIEDIFKKYNVTKGSATLTLNNGKATIAHGEHSVSGTYRYTRSTAGIVAEAIIDKKSVSAKGYVRYSSGMLTVMLDIREVMKAITTVAPEFKSDQNFILVESLLRDIGDVYVVGKFKK